MSLAHIALTRRHQGTCAICAVGEQGERLFPLSTSSTVWRGTVVYDDLQICAKHSRVSLLRHARDLCVCVCVRELLASLLLLSLSLNHPCPRLATLTS
jgi:hypothetical protein